MNKYINILITILVLSVSSIQVHAGTPETENNMVIKHDSDKEVSPIKSTMMEQEKPLDDVKLSDGISAGIITEREDGIIDNNHRVPTKKKGTEAGVGISISF
jgi:hypothetical protein